jgi:hypothetical protein
VLYSSSPKDKSCFVCKELFEVFRDEGVAAKKSLTSNSKSDENSYFLDAKRIRATLRNQETGELEKEEVNVHVDCLKKLEQLKAKRQQSEMEQETDQNRILEEEKVNKRARVE